MNMRRLVRTLSVGVFGGAALLFTTLPAHAEDSGWLYNSTSGAGGGWIDNGDKLLVCDLKVDGYEAVAWIENDTRTAAAAVYDTLDDGHCTRISSRLNTPAGNYYWVQFCLANSSTSAAYCAPNWTRVYNKT